MSLDIKELYNSDLNPNSNDWWSRPKVDKLNYNFNRLIDGGIRGPQGNQGTAGSTGLKGAQGVQGDAGVDGYQGPAGEDANLNWRYVDGDNNRTLYPNIEPTDYFGVSLIFGVPDGSTEYDAAAVFNQVSQHRVITDIGKKQMSLNFGDYDYDFLFDGSNLTLGKFPTSYISNLISINELNNSVIEYNPAINNTKIPSKVRVSDDLLQFIKNSNFTNKTVNGALEFTPNANTAKILTSIDSDGTLVWKNKYEALSILPIGSIISIPAQYFNSTNFELINSGTVVNGVLEVYWGRGKDNTAYSGWYICNGKTWNFQGGNQFLVPNLNSFTYNIDSNGGNQQAVTGGINLPILIAGADVNCDATFNSSLVSYSIDQTTDTSDITETFDAGSTHSVARNVNIINLGNPYLVWQTATPGVITEEIVLGYGSSTVESSCAAPSGNFYWTGFGITWSNLLANMTGVVLYDSNNNLATANKWYERDGVSRYWNGTAFTQVQSCELAISINLAYNLDVRNLNGSVSSSGTYTINGNALADATTLKFGGSLAIAGWYREISGSGVRRYWNGSIFSGESMSTTNVYYAGTLDVSYNNSSTACQFTDAAVKIYYATNSTVISGGSPLQEMYNALAVVYVHKDWSGTGTGTRPLVKIYSQNGVGGGVSPYGSIVADASNGSMYRAPITTVSRILSPIICSNYTINGITTISNSIPSTYGTISVTNTPAIISLQAFGGAGGNYCYTDATLSIFGQGGLTVSASAYENVSDTITIYSTGTYTYNLNAYFGCSSGNSATIS